MSITALQYRQVFQASIQASINTEDVPFGRTVNFNNNENVYFQSKAKMLQMNISKMLVCRNRTFSYNENTYLLAEAAYCIPDVEDKYLYGEQCLDNFFSSIEDILSDKRQRLLIESGIKETLRAKLREEFPTAS